MFNQIISLKMKFKHKTFLGLIAVLFVWMISPAKAESFPPGHFCNDIPSRIPCKVLVELKSGDLDKTIIVSHRGFWGQPGIPETSLLALQNAYDNDYTVTELDVLKTQDDVIVLFHDQQTNRLTDLPRTPDSDDPSSGSWIKDINYYTTTVGRVPKPGSGTYDRFPALKTARLKDRFGKITDSTMGTFEEALQWLRHSGYPRDIIITVDIKDKNKTDYFFTLSECLRLAKKYNLLHQILLKPGSAGEYSAQEVEEELGPDLWDDFSKKSNVTLVNTSDHKNAKNKTFIDDWIAVPSLIVVEQIFKTPDDRLLADDFYQGHSVVSYTKQVKNRRIGIFWDIPTDGRGTTNGRGTWNNPVAEDDNRGNPEFLYDLPEAELGGMLVIDRPVMAENFLRAKGYYNKFTKRCTVPD